MRMQMDHPACWWGKIVGQDLETGSFLLVGRNHDVCGSCAHGECALAWGSPQREVRALLRLGQPADLAPAAGRGQGKGHRCCLPHAFLPPR
jgi:hypothetical protein